MNQGLDGITIEMQRDLLELVGRYVYLQLMETVEYHSAQEVIDTFLISLIALNEKKETL